MKGVSPVVATVLLIAIAVIAAIGVWYWVGAYTGNPGVGVDQKAFSVEGCNLTHVLIRNTGSVALDVDADIYKEGVSIGYIEINSTTPLAAGNITYQAIVNTTPTTSGVYKVVDGDYPSYQFTCN